MKNISRKEWVIGFLVLGFLSGLLALGLARERKIVPAARLEVRQAFFIPAKAGERRVIGGLLLFFTRDVEIPPDSLPVEPVSKPENWVGYWTTGTIGEDIDPPGPPFTLLNGHRWEWIGSHWVDKGAVGYFRGGYPRAEQVGVQQAVSISAEDKVLDDYVEPGPLPVIEMPEPKGWVGTWNSGVLLTPYGTLDHPSKERTGPASTVVNGSYWYWVGRDTYPKSDPYKGWHWVRGEAAGHFRTVQAVPRAEQVVPQAIPSVPHYHGSVKSMVPGSGDGHYVGGVGSSHKGGHYVNPRTGNHYRNRQAGVPYLRLRKKSEGE